MNESNGSGENESSTATPRLEGRVVWFNNAKGYGFLGYEGGPDVFVHFSSVQSDGYKSLKEGEAVQFSIIDGDKGPQADHVIRVRRMQGAQPAE